MGRSPRLPARSAAPPPLRLDRAHTGGREAFVGRFLEWQNEEPRTRVQLCICRQDTASLIGNVGLRRAEPGGPVAEIGFELAPERWGRGYATEAAAAMLELGYREWSLHRISAHCVAENVASARVLEKLGMRREGLLRESQSFEDRWWDVLLFTVLRSEWAAAADASPRR